MATGVWIGIRPHTATAAHMARAAMEGVTLGLNYGLNRLRALGVVPREIRLTGGGAQSALWRQIAADVFDCPVVCPTTEEGAAYGAALHAMWVQGHATGAGREIGDITTAFVTMNDASWVVPEPGAAARYRDLQAIFNQAARDLAGTFSLHRRFLGGQVRKPAKCWFSRPDPNSDSGAPRRRRRAAVRPRLRRSGPRAPG